LIDQRAMQAQQTFNLGFHLIVMLLSFLRNLLLA